MHSQPIFCKAIPAIFLLAFSWLGTLDNVRFDAHHRSEVFQVETESMLIFSGFLRLCKLQAAATDAWFRSRLRSSLA
jgi:hypothetical protein